jgi:hypothetical protein
VRECGGARMRLLDIRSRHDVLLEKPEGLKFCIVIEKLGQRKWVSHLGLHTCAVWRGVGERA